MVVGLRCRQLRLDGGALSAIADSGCSGRANVEKVPGRGLHSSLLPSSGRCSSWPSSVSFVSAARSSRPSFRASLLGDLVWDAGKWSEPDDVENSVSYGFY